MTDKLNQVQIYDKGESLARHAETGSLAAVNKELDQIRSTTSPSDYKAIVRSMQGSNISHVSVDRQQVDQYNENRWKLFQAKEEPHVPTLYISDDSKDSKHPHYRVDAAGIDSRPATTGQPLTADAGAGTKPNQERPSESKQLIADRQSDSITFASAYNEGVAMREADKVQFPQQFQPAK